MRNIFFILLSILALVVLQACKKADNPPATMDAGTFFKNTEWVGTSVPLSRSYDMPFSLKFHGDNTLTIYSVFVLLIDGAYVRKDSVDGKINKVENMDNGIRVHVDFPTIKESQILTITDRKSLTNNVLLNPAKPNAFPFNLELFPAAGIDVRGSTWSGEVIQGGLADGKYAYPDLRGITFFEENNVTRTQYLRDGKVAAIGLPDLEKFYIISSVYQHRGARLYMAGFDETTNGGSLIPYFGVLKPSGDAMWVTPTSSGARVPNPVQTEDWYGPKGVTPVIYKLN